MQQNQQRQVGIAGVAIMHVVAAGQNNEARIGAGVLRLQRLDWDIGAAKFQPQAEDAHDQNCQGDAENFPNHRSPFLIFVGQSNNDRRGFTGGGDLAGREEEISSHVVGPVENVSAPERHGPWRAGGRRQ